MRNTVAKVIRVIAVAVIVLGVIGSLIAANSEINQYGDTVFSFGALLSGFLVTAIGGGLLFGFSEIIELLDAVKWNTEASGEAAKKMHQYLTRTPAQIEAENKFTLCRRCKAHIPLGEHTCPECKLWN